MGIFVGTKTEIAKFKATGTKLAKGAVMTASKIGNQVPNAQSGILSRLAAKVSSKIAPVKAGIMVAQLDKRAASAGVAMPLVATAPKTNTLLDKGVAFAKKHPILTAGAAAVAVGAAAYGVSRYRKSKAKKKTAKRKTSRKKTTSRSSSRRRTTSRAARSRRRKRGYGTEAQYKRKGGLDVKYTKNGQPYVIKSDGRARFIKRSR